MDCKILFSDITIQIVFNLLLYITKFPFIFVYTNLHTHRTWTNTFVLSMLAFPSMFESI